MVLEAYEKIRKYQPPLPTTIRQSSVIPPTQRNHYPYQKYMQTDEFLAHNMVSYFGLAPKVKVEQSGNYTRYASLYGINHARRGKHEEMKVYT